MTVTIDRLVCMSIFNSNSSYYSALASIKANAFVLGLVTLENTTDRQTAREFLALLLPS